MTARLAHKAGDIIGPRDRCFRVEERIAVGGMGTVYRVTDMVSGMSYAAKECDLLDDPRGRGLAREEALRIFLRECRLMERLRTEGIPRGFLVESAQRCVRICLQCSNPVLEQDTSCTICKPAPDSIYLEPQAVDHRYYLIMDFITGTDAGSLVSRMPKPLQGKDLQTVMGWMAELAAILEALHRQNLMHRDIKPENLRIQQADGRLFLLDLGLLSEPSMPRATKMLAASDTRLLGTSGFAPPEQMAGQPSLESDVYALAMSFLCMATGLDPANPDEKAKLKNTRPEDLVPQLPRSVATLLKDALGDVKRPSAGQLYQAFNFSSTQIRTTLDANDPAPLPYSKVKQKTWMSRAIRSRSLLKWLVPVMLLLVIWAVFVSPRQNPSFEVHARPGAAIYKQPQKAGTPRQLLGGERLLVRYPLDTKEQKWLEVLKLEERKTSGYVVRTEVDHNR